MESPRGCDWGWLLRRGQRTWEGRRGKRQRQVGLAARGVHFYKTVGRLGCVLDIFHETGE